MQQGEEPELEGRINFLPWYPLVGVLIGLALL